MPLYNSTYLKQVSRTKTLNESTRMFSEKNKTHTFFDIFLSHSFLDKEDVEGLYIELTRMGFSVYVDWIIDPNLDRSNVTKATATLIREKMKSSKTLLLAISNNASVSKWMPWELGYMDGFTSKCAIVPVSATSSTEYSYKGFEYLSLYPFIKKIKDSNDIDKLWVIDDSQKYVVLESWLKGTKPYQRDVNISNL
ncbi:TIR domain-containing protein [Sphingobacterium chungjuense]|uniref:TIR domain-containing protein n=1 Tax=Sphingobacterium chungjuense TaxID=2675553 RepID=UPI0019D21854|nr:TIR domain-containing protein [Sphingobacterium chungjuense]